MKGKETKVNFMHWKKELYELRGILLLWLTQSVSSLGSAMTNFALVVWSYQAEGSALQTALLSVCSYAPYVLVSIFAGAVSDRLNKKAVMLVSDAFAACCTVTVLVLLHTGRLQIGHLYVLNALNGLMNTFQQPASDVTISLLTPARHYQRVSGLRSLSSSVTSMAAPVLAGAMVAAWGMDVVIAFDLATFAFAALTLLFGIRIPPVESKAERREGILRAAGEGLRYLRANRGILHIIFFLAAINLTASMYNAALPARLLPLAQGERAYSVVNAVCGAAMIAGSVLATLAPKPKNRVRVICNTLLLSMSTENFCLALGDSLPMWCIGATLGWIGIPLMNANLDVVMRTSIPLDMQGRVYSARNTLQFFTIPLGYVLGGWLTDAVFEPLMARAAVDSLPARIFGVGKGSGAAALFFLLAWLGVATCLVFRKDRHILALQVSEQGRE